MEFRRRKNQVTSGSVQGGYLDQIEFERRFR